MLKKWPVTIYEDEKYLRQISKEVDFNDKNLKNDIKVLAEYCKEEDVLAMAAVQLRIPKRIVYLKNTDLSIVNRHINGEDINEYNEQQILINPVITSKEGLTKYWEACASCVDNMGLVRRPYKIIVEYFDIDGKKHIETYEGFKATVLSHEIDHLDGILHIDIADEVLVMKEEDRKEFRKTHNYEIIYKDGNFIDLLKED